VTNRARDFEAEALELPPEERARLAERLISSLDPETDPQAGEFWRQEAERRLAEIQSGSGACLPGADVIEKARSTLR
jgi:putative addiction module component (TIGR02574 family)